MKATSKKIALRELIYSYLLMFLVTAVGTLFLIKGSESRLLVMVISSFVHVFVGGAWAVPLMYYREVSLTLISLSILVMGFLQLNIVSKSGLSFMEILNAAIEGGAVVPVGLMLVSGVVSLMFSLKGYRMSFAMKKTV